MLLCNDPVGFQRTDQRMGVQKIELNDIVRRLDQPLEVPQSPGAVVGGGA